MRRAIVRSRLLVAAASIVLVLLAAAGVAWWRMEGGGRQAAAPAPAPGIIAGSPMIGGPFTLVDHTGRQVTDATFRGKHLLVFFGFTNCPDVCPTALDRFAQVLELLGPAGEAVQPLMISVDPERDTPEVLARYVAAFHPRLVGLTGSPEQVKAVASAYKVYFAKAPPGEGSYDVSHSTFEYLMGPDSRNLYVLRSEAEPEKIAELIRGMTRQGISAAPPGDTYVSLLYK